MIDNENIINEDSEISVVIPTYKRPDMLIRLLESIIISTIAVKEIIVIDGFPNSNIDLILHQKFPYIKYFKFDRIAYVGELRNLGLKISAGKYVFMVDDDNTISSDCIANLYNEIKKDPLIGVVGPVTCYFNNKNMIMYAGSIYSRFMRRTIFLYNNSDYSNVINLKYEVDGFANSYLFRKDAALKVYPIPDRILFGGEDGYIQYRIKKELGMKLILVGRARVFHDINPNDFYSRMTPFKLYYLARGKITFERDLDNGGKFLFSLYLPIYIYFYLYMALHTKNKKYALTAVLLGLIDGILKNYINRY